MMQGLMVLCLCLLACPAAMRAQVSPGSVPSNFDTNYWEFYAVRFGGHPLQYVLKDGKLYVGIIGQDEEYFFRQPHTKVQ